MDSGKLGALLSKLSSAIFAAAALSNTGSAPAIPLKKSPWMKLQWSFFTRTENVLLFLMNTENYEQVHISHDVLGDAVDYLIPNLQIKMEFFDGKPVGIELPQTVDLTVVETEPGLKSATASSVTKPAKTETGLIVQVPPFINEGEKIRVDTAEGAYLSRA